jgi:hypothetical protein
MTKIDWPNHFVGFFSALFGILIAFELDEWKESRKDDKIADNAFIRMQQEIDMNRNMLRGMVTVNLQMIGDLEGQVLDKVDNRLMFTGTAEQALAVNNTAPLSSIAFVQMPQGDRKQNTQAALHVVFSGLTVPVIYSSAWESARTIGALNNMSYEKVLTLSSLYNPPRILDELTEVRALLRNADDIDSKAELQHLLDELDESYRIIAAELDQLDAFAAMLDQME